MAEVVGNVFHCVDQIAHMQAIGRRADAIQGRQRIGCRHRLRYRADAADARHDGQRVQRLAAQQYPFEAAK
jgi:hypothetical protein